MNGRHYVKEIVHNQVPEIKIFIIIIYLIISRLEFIGLPIVIQLQQLYQIY